MCDLKIGDYIAVDAKVYIFKVTKQHVWGLDVKCIYAVGKEFSYLKGMNFKIRKNTLCNYHKVPKLRGKLLECV